MIAFVQSNQVTAVNSEEFGYPANPNGIPFQIPCPDTQIIGSYWRVPQVIGNRVIGYQYIVAVETSAPYTPDSLKILRVKLTNTAGITTLDMAIANTDNISTSSPPNQFAYLCDGNGGSLPVMPTTTIPTPILQLGPQSTATNGTNTFIFPFPANPSGLLYTISAAWFNGQAATPTYAPSGITTAAQFVTWANSHWSAYGTWSSSGDIVSLASATGSPVYVTKAGINISLTPAPYCFDLTAYSSPAPVNQVEFGTGGLVSVPAFELTNNPVVLMNVLIRVMASNTIFDATSVAHKLTVTTTQATPKLYNNGVLVVSSSPGVCS